MSRVQGRAETSLNARLERNLTTYALAAGAAGVGLLAWASPAEGRVVYTPADQAIPVDTTYQFDLNHDGRFDFTLSNFATSFAAHKDDGTVPNPQTGGFEAYLAIKGSRLANQPVMNSSYNAAAIRPQQLVGPGLPFFKKLAANRHLEFCGGSNDSSSGPRYHGSWKNVRHRYLGLKFKINGEIHYAWARLRVSLHLCDISATLTGYAYETVPKKPIMTGDKGKADVNLEPARLGHLALGAAGRR